MVRNVVAKTYMYHVEYGDNLFTQFSHNDFRILFP
jgi:hypothetical protein